MRRLIFSVLGMSIFILITLLAVPLENVIKGKLVFPKSYGPETRFSGGIALPLGSKESSIQIYGARLLGLRGAFAIHTWVAIKSKSDSEYTTYEMDDDPDIPDEEENFFLVNKRRPDQAWFGSKAFLIYEVNGPEAEHLIKTVKNAIDNYPYQNMYRSWPGPNCNTFTQYVIDHTPEIKAYLPSAAIGKTYNYATGFTNEDREGKLLSSLFKYRKDGELVTVTIMGLNYEFDINKFNVNLPGSL
ncbi:DUF3750 domain-containing protein [Pectobacterium parvum]|uniref:DUF3750 domain-containing protein n=1 Tax=Pectobacterium parvum TaxID=2778550 RepID=A0AAP9LBI2_9GAMM|nr:MULTISPECIES: DUF3750 domain-containing protein [Pectobacterium]GKW40878.1 hypothetical protein PEC301879_07370 [Pectobacterium carotovorum subsp. carotovorum]MCU1800695.1 DUF3750 domain-containing protein [Pectobacterium parvum]QHQ23232.1 DUF3750 domain-containing protein [Pectobacterium parvum]UFK38894.1 DUF3750 domain-containing protein [Pectobacterium parvum]UVD97015.1 DUF3750 domain-containing protein [Pectobacterium parvum]